LALLPQLLTKARAAIASPAARGIATLVAGTAFAQAIPLLSTFFVLAKIYAPAAFGEQAFFLAFAAVAAVPATGRYELAILLPKSQAQATSLAYVAVLFASGSLLLAYGAVGVYHLVTGALGAPPYPEAWLLPITIWGLGVMQAANYLLIRRRAYTSAVLARVVQTGSVAGLSIWLGYDGWERGLVAGSVAGTALGAVGSMALCAFSVGGLRWPGRKLVRASALRYKQYPIYNALPATLDSASLQLPVTAVKRYFDASAAGFFSVNRQVIGGPLSIISQAVSQALFRRLVELRQSSGGQRAAERFVWMLAAGLTGVAILTGIVILLFSDWLFVTVWGAQWAPAADFARILLAGLLIKFIVSPLSIVFPVYDKLRRNAAWQAAYFVGLCSLWFIHSWEIGPFLWAFTGIEVALYVAYFWLIIHTVRTQGEPLLTMVGKRATGIKRG